MIDFRPIELNDKKRYNQYLYEDSIRGCEYSFGNLFMWGLQNIAELENHIVLYSRLDTRCFYPFPIGTGDKKEVLDAIFSDAKARGICPCLTGLNEDAKNVLESLYPNQFYFHADRANYDYIYDIHALADLKGRKFHRKRNHLKHFKNRHPGYQLTPITMENINRVRAFLSDWYQIKLQENPNGDYHNEQSALDKVFAYYEELEMEGLLLEEDGEVLGFTIASQISNDTFDVHFEKARGDIDGAYTTINSEFANYIRKKYPHIQYLNREEDMGLSGLRKAKLSYFPHHFVKKYKALPLLLQYSFSEPSASMEIQLRKLWKDSFGDSDEFLNQFFTYGFHKTRCRVAMVNDNPSTSSKDLAAALYWFDCEVEHQRIAYIYAVATSQKYRGNGACHTLLADTHQHLKSLGYAGAILVPGNDSLVHLYEGCEYERCTKRSRHECQEKDMGITIQEIKKDEYSLLRKEYLPTLAVIQEKENLDFLETQARFYTSQGSEKDFLLAAHIDEDTLYGIELLGDSTCLPGIVHALGCQTGVFFTPGKEENFAMYHSLIEEAIVPSYFGFAFD